MKVRGKLGQPTSREQTNRSFIRKLVAETTELGDCDLREADIFICQGKGQADLLRGPHLFWAGQAELS